MTIKVDLKPSKIRGKKYTAIIYENEDKRATVHFGATGYSDYTKHGNPERKERYIDRHKKNEDWTKSGIDTAGFWSRWILWNKETIGASKTDTENRFNIKIN